MSRTTQLIVGAVLFLLVVGGLVVLAIRARAIKESETVRTVHLPQIPTEFLNLQLSQYVQDLEINGEIPVKVKPEELRRDDPFAPL